METNFTPKVPAMSSQRQPKSSTNVGCGIETLKAYAQTREYRLERFITANAMAARVVKRYPEAIRMALRNAMISARAAGAEGNGSIYGLGEEEFNALELAYYFFDALCAFPESPDAEWEALVYPIKTSSPTEGANS